MDETNLRLVRESFQKVAALARPAAVLFFGRLFRIEPATRAALEREDMRAQGARFIAALGYATAMLDRPDRLLPVARDLARRHAARGLRPEHYPALREALDWMLEECLAEEFLPPLRAAWRWAFDLLAEEMIAEAYPDMAA
nr:globin domain-containing protein [uncultured Roseococcus sp.]